MSTGFDLRQVEARGVSDSVSLSADPELKAITEAWPHLSPDARAAILSMAREAYALNAESGGAGAMAAVYLKAQNLSCDLLDDEQLQR